jgi:hypothetical protein
MKGTTLKRLKIIIQEVLSKETIKGGLADNYTLNDLVKRHKLSDSSSLKTQLEMGIKVEMEHTKSKQIAKEIAMDHLWEDPKYYTKLKKIEKNG